MNPKIFTTIGAISGILGGVLISFPNGLWIFPMVFGFYVWLFGNTAWIIGGILLRDWGIVGQFLFFQLVSANAIYQWR